MENIFTNVLNRDINYHILFLLHKIQLNEVFNELFQKIRNFNILEEILDDYDCTHFITYKRGKLILTIHHPIYKNGTGWLVYLS